jgi:succinate dehydrogenase/fumarate reductase flavoprotein subunit
MGDILVDAGPGADQPPGLFATGECSGGMPGANRLGGNSLSDLLVSASVQATARPAMRATRRGRASMKRTSPRARPS